MRKTLTFIYAPVLAVLAALIVVVTVSVAASTKTMVDSAKTCDASPIPAKFTDVTSVERTTDGSLLVTRWGSDGIRQRDTIFCERTVVAVDAAEEDYMRVELSAFPHIACRCVQATIHVHDPTEFASE